MSKLRARKVQALQADIADAEVYGDADGIGVVSWGSTFGAVRTGVDVARAAGQKVGHVHLRWLSPLPSNLKSVLEGFSKATVAEMNLGQLHTYLRGEFLLDLASLTKIQGQPFKTSEIVAHIQKLGD